MSDQKVPCECVECACTYLADEEDRESGLELLCDECAMDNHNEE